MWQVVHVTLVGITAGVEQTQTWRDEGHPVDGFDRRHAKSGANEHHGGGPGHPAFVEVAPLDRKACGREVMHEGLQGHAVHPAILILLAAHTTPSSSSSRALSVAHRRSCARAPAAPHRRPWRLRPTASAAHAHAPCFVPVMRPPIAVQVR